MFLEMMDGGRIGTEKKPGAIMELLPPSFEVNGRELAFEVVEEKGEEGVAVYRLPSCGDSQHVNALGDGVFVPGFRFGGMEAFDQITPMGDGLFAIDREVVNNSPVTRTGKLILEARECFIPVRTSIPCVSYDGNHMSREHEPHGYDLDGEPWIFSYDRMSIPACTIAENRCVAAALFASDRDPESLRSSCSFIAEKDGGYRHRIFYPVTEAPLTYSDHDIFADRYDEYVTLQPGERFAVRAYIWIGVPKYENYGTISLFDRVAEIFPFRHGVSITPEEAYESAIAHAKFMMCDYHGVKMFRNVMRDNPEDDSIYFPHPVFEAGWSGQCFQQSRMFILDYVRHGNKEMLDAALSCLDAWMETQFPNGLFPTNYARHISREYVPGDICNYGWAGAEAVRSYALLKSLGISRERYLEFAVRLCDFFVEHYDERDGFGIRWDMQGNRADSGSNTSGGFMIMALIELYRETGEKKYLDCARKSFELYKQRDIDRFIFTGGALDCGGMDKECAYPWILTSLDLLEITGDEGCLETALKAAGYFWSWAFQYDALYPPESDFSKYGYYTSGGTAISTLHPAIDLWGIIVVPEYFRLAEITRDDIWRNRAVALWRNATLCITPKGGAMVLGHRRPYGLQSEAFFQARWTRYRRNCESRGHLNDMYVIWPAAYRLAALDKMLRLYGEKGWDLLR
ncbi:hypothetical protein [uncultured Victivallis sp.]|uniref:hypothetical protein n=1 Tax=uncultured Victivallis sp. TaxID=354118 RepID=UPI0025F4A887|nr:hypothetical protein [uncultured Victivallis sp.]